MIGIMSDSHDNVDAVKAAVHLFNDQGCRLVIHAGDFVAPFAARILEGLSCPVKAVFGNCDGEKSGLRAAFDALGTIADEPLVFSFEEKKILIQHVNFELDRRRRRFQPDILVYGHTHKPEVRRREGTLVVNPGETGGWVNGRCTVALLDEERMEAEIIGI